MMQVEYMYTYIYIYIYIYIYTLTQPTAAQSAEAVEYVDSILPRDKIPPNECPRYDTK